MNLAIISGIVGSNKRRKQIALVMIIGSLASCRTEHATQFERVSEGVAAMSENAVNLNTATSSEMEMIPHIGSRLAGRIVAYREEYGPFRRPEEILLIQGISDRRFREIRHLIKVE